MDAGTKVCSNARDTGLVQDCVLPGVRSFGSVFGERTGTNPYSTEACSTMRAPEVLSSAFSLNASARQGARKRSLFKSIGVSPENQRWLPKQ